MKLNLPSTWTKQKINSLLLLTLVGTLPTQAGTNFEKCLTTNFNGLMLPIDNVTNLYNHIVSFGNSVPDKESFCCDVGISQSCSPLSPNCPYDRFNVAQCNKIGQSKFCISDGGIWNTLPGGLCGGILGDSLPVNSTVGTCPSSEAVGKILTSQSTTPTFSWLCCDSNNCRVPIRVIIANNLANTSCIFNQYSLMCFQDNEAWTFTGNISPNITNINNGNLSTQPIGNCILQVVLPNSTSLVSNALPSNSSNNPDLNKIIIPVGTVFGTVTIGGVVYCLYKRRKNRKNQQGNDSQLFELVNTGQSIIDLGNTGQPISAPQNIRSEEQSKISGLGTPIISGLGMVTSPSEEECTAEELPSENIELQEFQSQVQVSSKKYGLFRKK